MKAVETKGQIRLPEIDAPLMNACCQPVLYRLGYFPWQVDNVQDQVILVEAQSIVGGGLLEFDGDVKSLEDSIQVTQKV